MNKFFWGKAPENFWHFVTICLQEWIWQWRKVITLRGQGLCRPILIQYQWYWMTIVRHGTPMANLEVRHRIRIMCMREWNDRAIGTIWVKIKMYTFRLDKYTVLLVLLVLLLSCASINDNYSLKYLTNLLCFYIFKAIFWSFFHGGVLGSLGSPLATCLAAWGNLEVRCYCIFTDSSHQH
jgi:hypothetical protein